MPKTYPQVGCYDGGEASKHALQICWRVQHIALSYEQQRYQDRSRKHWKRLKVNNVKHGDEHGDTKKEDQQVEAKLVEQVEAETQLDASCGAAGKDS